MDEHPPIDPAELAAGTSALLRTAGRDSGRDALHACLATEDAAVLVVTTTAAQDAVDDLGRRGVQPDAIGVVDASGGGVTPSGIAEAATADDSGALSSLGIAISDLLDRLDNRFDRVYVGLDSTTDLLEVAPLPVTFRFLHVLSGRIRTSDAILVATIDRSAHDEETLLTISELFDEVVDVD